MYSTRALQTYSTACVFYRLHLIEAYGTGMGKIIKAYENEDSKPSIETTRNTFKIILPNINAKHETRKPSIYNVHQSTDCATRN